MLAIYNIYIFVISRYQGDLTGQKFHGFKNKKEKYEQL